MNQLTYSIKKVSPKDWVSIKNRIMDLEKRVFAHLDLDQEEEDLMLTFTNPEAFSFIVEDSFENVLAYIAASDLENYISEDMPFPASELHHLGKRDSIYVESIAVHPEFERSDFSFGTQLLQAIIDQAKTEHKSRVVGHWLPASANLFTAFGAEHLETYQEWAEDNEGNVFDAHYMILELDSVEETIEFNELDLPDSLEENLRGKVNLLYREFLRLDTVTKALLPEEEQEEYEAVSEIFERNIGSIIGKAFDNKTLELVMLYFESTLNKFDELLDTGLELSSVKTQIKSVSYYLGESLIYFPDVFDRLQNSSKIDDYKTIIRIVIGMCNSDDNSINYSLDKGRELLEYKADGWKRHLLDQITNLRELGENYYADAFLEIFSNNYQGEMMHMEAGFDDFIKNCIPLANSGFRKETDKLVELLLKMKGFGSPVLTAIGLFVKNLNEFDKKGEINLLHDYMDITAPFLGYNFNICWQVADFRNLKDAIEEYEKVGAPEILPINLKRLIALDGLYQENEHSFRNRSYIPSLEYTFNYPIFYELIGEEGANALFDEIEELTILELQNSTNKNQGKLTSLFLFRLKDMIKENPDEFKELYNDEQKFSTLIDMIKGIVRQPAHLSEGKVIEQMKHIVETIQSNEGFQVYTPFAETITRYGLLGSMSRLKSTIESDLSQQQTMDFLRHYSIVQYLPNLPIIRDPKSFYQSISERIGLSNNELTDWIEKVLATDYHIEYSKLLPTILESRIDLEKSLELMPILHKYNIHESIAELKYVVEANESLEKKDNFLRKLEEGERWLLLIKPIDTFNFTKWKSEAETEVETYLEKEFGLQPDYELTPEMIQRIVQATSTSQKRQILRTMARLETKKQTNLASIWRPDKIYGRRQVTPITQDTDIVTATRTLVNGLISRHPERISHAEKLFDSRVLNPAREYINASHVPPNSLYWKIRQSLNAIDNSKQPQNEIEAAEKILKQFRSDYLTGSTYSSERYQLLTLLNIVNDLGKEAEEPDEIVAQMQGFRLSDLFDGKRLHCCAFLSSDKERTEIASLNYQGDPYIGLLHINALQSKRNLGLPVGVGIMASCLTEREDSVILMDSPEGGSILHKIRDDLYLSLILEGFIGVAQDAQAPYMFVPNIAMNGMPKRWKSFFTQFIGRDQPEEIYLSKRRGFQHDEVRIPHDKRLLETWNSNDRSTCSGRVKGFLVQTDDIHQAYQKAYAVN